MFRVKHDTEKREENRQTRSGPKHRKKSSVLRRCLKTVNDGDEVTLDGRLFHTREAATGKARSPIVENEQLSDHMNMLSATDDDRHLGVVSTDRTC